MKKSPFLLFILFFALQTLSSAQIVNILSEDFNVGFPAAWLNLDDDTSTPAPAVATIAGDAFAMHEDYDTLGTGDSILIATSWFSPVATASNYLILPQMSLQANGNQLVFQFKSKDPSYAERFEVLLSVTGSAIGDFTDTLYENGLANPYWTEISVDLDQYAGQQIYLAVHHSSNDKFILCLDNFRVFADLQLGQNELKEEPQLELFPNPAREILQLRSSEEMNGVRIYDLSGRLVYNENFNAVKNAQLNLSSFQSGSYLLMVENAKGTTTRRFVRL